MSDLIPQICKGDLDAERFLRMVVEAADFFDDLVDGDQPVSRERIEKLAWLTLVALPMNPFYRQHAPQLASLMSVATQNWALANEYEERGEGLDVARILRSSFVDIMAHTATLCGGPEHGRAMTALIRAWTHHEDQETYERNLKNERRARSVEA